MTNIKKIYIYSKNMCFAALIGEPTSNILINSLKNLFQAPNSKYIRMEGIDILIAKKAFQEYIDTALELRKTNFFVNKFKRIFIEKYQGLTIELDIFQQIDNELLTAIGVYNFLEKALLEKEFLEIYISENLEDECAEANAIFIERIRIEEANKK